MAGQATWGNVGDATNARIVVPKIQREAFYKSVRRTLFSKMNYGPNRKERMINYEGDQYQMIGTSSIVQEIPFGNMSNEWRGTLVERFTGMATYGDTAVKTGAYPQYKHVSAWVN